MTQRDRVLSMLGMAARAGRIESGEFSTEKAVKSGRGRNGIADACVLATVDLERRERIGGNDYFRGHGRLFRFRGRCCHRNGVRVHERYDGVGPDDRCDSYGFGVA